MGATDRATDGATDGALKGALKGASGPHQPVYGTNPFENIGDSDLHAISEALRRNQRTRRPASDHEEHEHEEEACGTTDLPDSGSFQTQGTLTRSALRNRKRAIFGTLEFFIDHVPGGLHLGTHLDTHLGTDDRFKECVLATAGFGAWLTRGCDRADAASLLHSRSLLYVPRKTGLLMTCGGKSSCETTEDHFDVGWVKHCMVQQGILDYKDEDGHIHVPDLRSHLHTEALRRVSSILLMAREDDDPDGPEPAVGTSESIAAEMGATGSEGIGAGGSESHAPTIGGEDGSPQTRARRRSDPRRSDAYSRRLLELTTPSRFLHDPIEVALLAQTLENADVMRLHKHKYAERPRTRASSGGAATLRRRRDAGTDEELPLSIQGPLIREDGVQDFLERVSDQHLPHLLSVCDLICNPEAQRELVRLSVPQILWDISMDNGAHESDERGRHAYGSGVHGDRARGRDDRGSEVDDGDGFDGPEPPRAGHGETARSRWAFGARISTQALEHLKFCLVSLSRRASTCDCDLSPHISASEGRLDPLPTSQTLEICTAIARSESRARSMLPDVTIDVFILAPLGQLLREAPSVRVCTLRDARMDAESEDREEQLPINFSHDEAHDPVLDVLIKKDDPIAILPCNHAFLLESVISLVSTARDAGTPFKCPMCMKEF